MIDDSPAKIDVMLLAAGLGRRLRPLTDTLPKPLVKVGGTALIDRVVGAAEAEGYRHFVANLHAHADLLRAHLVALSAARPALRFRFSEEPALLDTGGGLKQALALMDTDPVLVMNTDAFWPAGIDRPLQRMVKRLEPGDTDIVLLCAQPWRSLGFGRSHDFCLDPRGRLTLDSGQPVIYAGVALLRRGLAAAVEAARFSLYDLFVGALERQRLAGVVLDAPWLHVGDPNALAEAERYLAEVAD